VTEVFIGKSGNFTPLAETVRSFKEICDGKWDHLPEQAFMYVGTVEEAAEQAKRLSGTEEQAAATAGQPGPAT